MAGADLGFQKGGLFFLPNSGCGFSNSKGYIYIYIYIYTNNKKKHLLVNEKRRCRDG